MGNVSFLNTRRSSRVRVRIPVLLASVEPKVQYSAVCEALVVNAHGCAMRSPEALEPGVAVSLRTKGGGETRARIVRSQIIASDKNAWMLGVSFDKAGNFWRLSPCPEDWVQAPDSRPENEPTELLQPPAVPVSREKNESSMRVSAHILKPGLGHPDASCGVENQLRANTPATHPPAQGLASSRDTLAEIPRPEQRAAGPCVPLPEGPEQLRAIVADLMQPLQTELKAVREEVAETERKRQAAISLAQIPSDLEERLWIRLRQHLEGDLSRNTQLLQDRFVAIAQQLEIDLREQMIDSLRRLSGMVGVARGENSGYSSDRVRQEICAAIRREGEAISLWLAQQTEDFRNAIRDAITETSGEMERLYQDAERVERSIQDLQHEISKRLEERAHHSAQQVQAQFEEACKRLRDLGASIQLSVAESIRTQTEQSMSSSQAKLNQLAVNVIGHCRSVLGRDLKLIANVLDQQPTMEGLSTGAEEEGTQSS